MTPWVVRYGWPPGHFRAGAPGYTAEDVMVCSRGRTEARAWVYDVETRGGWAEAYPADITGDGTHQRLMPWGVGP